MRTRAIFVIAAALTGAFVLAAPAAPAHAQAVPSAAGAYVVREASNLDVDVGSSCLQPDQSDVHPVSPPATTTNSVALSACLFQNTSRVDTLATFDSSGVGVISSCPDPDGAGPKTATLSLGGLRCTLTGFTPSQEYELIGSGYEYHVRVNSTVPGSQVVVFCYDPDVNGCSDETVTSTVTVFWTAGATSAVAYINRETGLATENSDVNVGSSCSTPDQSDTQVVSPPATTTRSVHVGGCLLVSASKVDGQATFESSGVGVISLCPDPDGAGAKTATLSANGLRCTQTGYQAADQEFHLRANSTVAGTQVVVFCIDLDGDGCADETLTSAGTVLWVVGANSAVAYISPDTGLSTANSSVNSNSSCTTPDQSDGQLMSPLNTTTNSVHVAACLFSGATRVDGQVTWESSGVGAISSCPDPDGAGPKTASLSINSLRCTQTGYQSGDLEFHIRVNNTATVGTQTIVICSDNDGDGCLDETVSSVVTVTWQGLADAAVAYVNRDTGLATVNPDVLTNSSCATPDQADTQVVSPAGTTTNSVHVAGCLLRNAAITDGQAT